MKNPILVISLVLLFCFTIGCKQRGEEAADKSAVDIKADLETIKHYFETYASTIAAGDLDGWTNHFAEDTVAMPPNEATITGKENIGKWGQPFFVQYKQEESITIEEVELAGKWAFVRNIYTLKLAPKAGGEPFQANGKGIWIFKRQVDKTWKPSQIIWNSNDPLPALPEKK